MSAMITAQRSPSQSLAQQSLIELLKGSLSDRILLLAALLGIAMAWFGIQHSIAAGPAMVEIYHADRLLASYPLPVPGQPAIHFEAEGDLGISDIEIDAKGVRMSASPCTSQRCVLSGNHRHAGDMIVCVPNKIMVSIRGGRTASDIGLDAVAE